MPNITKKPLKTKVVKSRNSKEGFKTRILTLLRHSKTTSQELESTVPTITLAGKWMYEAGFRSGQKVEIIVKDQQLLLKVRD